MKEQLKKNRNIHKILLLVYVPVMSVYFKIWSMVGIPFRYELPNKSTVRLYPKGQIIKGVFFGSFEKDEVEMIYAFLKPGMTVVDVGANVGLYSIISAQRIGSKGKVWSFEPSNESYKRLKKNVELNDYSSVIEVNNIGLGNRSNEIINLRRDVGYGDAERYIMPDNKKPKDTLDNVSDVDSLESVNLSTLDLFLSEKGSLHVDFIKMDVEGYEYYVLQGSLDVMEANPNLVMIIECTDLGTRRAGHTQQDVLDLINKYGYEGYYWDYDNKIWLDDREGLFKSGYIWSSKSRDNLPVIK